jgi:general secretion pathway protein M
MSSRALAMPPNLALLRAQSRVWWRGRAPRERAALAVGGALLGGLLAWSLLIGPAWRTARSAPAELDRLEVQLQQMQRLAAEAKALKGAPPVSAAQAAAPLRAATERLGDKATIVFQGDRATLTLTGVSGGALRAWLAEARSAARARATEVQLTRNAEGFAGLVVVSLGTGP